jgi:hypothetical protein
MTTIKRRLDNIDKSLTPRQALLAWIAEAHRFSSLSEYAVWLAEQPNDFQPLRRLLHQVAAPIFDHKTIAPEEREKTKKAALDVVFLYFLHHRVNCDSATRSRSMALEAALLLDGHCAALERDGTRDDALKVLRYLAEVPYPLDAEDASSVLAAIRNQVVTFAQFAGSAHPWFHYDENPAVWWVRAHFAREGRTTIPLDVCVARDRDEYAKGWPRQHRVHGLDREQIVELFADRNAYSDFMSGRDFSYGLADVRDEEFNRVVISVVGGLRKLTESGEIQAARQGFLSSVPVPFLRRVPMVNGEWIDRYVVELAEFGSLLLEHGYAIQEGPDTHPLAWPLISASDGAEADLEAIRATAAASVTAFPGRVTSIDGRPFLNVTDYLAWPDRKFRGELEFEEGFSLASFNAWAEANKLNRRAELNGVITESIPCAITASSLIVSADASLEQTVRAKAIETLLAMSTGRIKADNQLGDFGTYALQILTTKAVIEYIENKYFEGHRVLWKSAADELDRYVKTVHELATYYAERDFANRVSRAGEKSSHARARGDRRRRSELDLDRLKQSIDPREQAKSLIVQAKAEALHFMGDFQSARELLSSILHDSGRD